MKLNVIIVLVLVSLTGAGLWGIYQWGRAAQTADAEKIETKRAEAKADATAKQRDIAARPHSDPVRILERMRNNRL